MEQFFVRVLTAVITSDAVKKMLDGMLKDISDDIKTDIHAMISGVEDQIDDLEKKSIDNLDAMDGKMGNLQEQLTSIPGDIIQGILTPLENLLKNPLGGLFGPR